MKLTSTVLITKDIDGSVAFYKDVLDMNVLQDFGANKTLDGGLALQTLDSWSRFIDDDGVTFGNKDLELYFEVEDFDGMLKKIQDYEVKYLHSTKTHSWGQRVVRFYDPDMHVIEVGESMLAVIKRFLNSGLDKTQVAIRMDVPIEYIESMLNV